jgi:hypothetical protein
LITDNGSTDTLDSFTFFIDGQEVNLDEAVAVAPGVHTVTEEWTDAHELNDTIESRYTVSYGLDCAADGTVDIAAGEDLTCEIVNDDRPATVTVTKLINGSGPLTLSSDFTMTVDGTNATTPTGVVVDGQLQFAGDESGTVVTLDAGAYSVSEFQEDNYFAFPTAGCTGTLIPGQAVTCTITNTYFPPLPNTGFVSVHKVIDGGQAAPEDFQFVVTENGVPGAPVNFDASGTNVIELPIGASYSIAEVDPTGLGYAVTDSGTCSGTVSLAGNPACTITNTVMTAPLTITKEIFDNDTATPDQFEYMVVDIGASTVIAQDFFEADGEVVIDIEVGTSVAVSELDPGSDWDVDAVGCEDVMDADGMECVITNDFIVVPPAPLDDIFPTLSCVDDLGNGMLNAHFGYNNTNGFEVFLEAGSFDNRMNGGGLVDQNAGQTSSFSIGENDDVFQVAFDGAIPLTWTLVAGDSNSITADSNSPSCTPVEPGTITIRKILVQDNGASDALSNFEFFIGSNEVSLDVANEVDPGTYTLSEEWDVAPEGVTEVSELYDVSFSPECPDGVVTIVGSEDVTCTITNNDIPPGTSGSGGGSGGSGNGRSDGDNPAPPNNDDAPEGEVLGDTDEQDPATDDEAATDEVVDEAEDEVTQAPDPIVAGDTDELPRTGLPAAGLLLVPSVLLFYVRRRQD